MGTHPSLPSVDYNTGTSLKDIIADGDNAATMLAPSVVSLYGSNLPFLFKVLSINQALSIQAHPNKTLAGELHARDPKNYPDDNHKPEMAIALTEFEGLCGFRPLTEIRHFLQTVKPFRNLVGEESAAAFESGVDIGKDADTDRNKTLLREAFSSMMVASQDDITAATAELIKQINDKSVNLRNPHTDPPVTGDDLAQLVLRLNKQYPDDIGLFNLFFLNYIRAQPGEALFLQADDIHAYLSGGESSFIVSVFSIHPPVTDLPFFLFLFLLRHH